MPNFGLVINSTYNPMSFEQYAAPFEKYAQVYGQMADAFDALEIEANKWEKLASSSQDQAQYEQYKNYAKDLRAAANDLAENGLSTKTRGLVSSLRGRYASEIQPIEEAYNLREKERELQRQALLQNPDIMFSRDASNTGLSAYMNGTPALQTYNGARLYEYTSKAIEQLAQAAREDLMENGANSEWHEVLDGQYYQKDNYKGVTADVIMQSMFDANGKIRPEANKYLKAIGEGAIELSGMRNWSNWNDVASRAYSYINQGLWGAIGTEEEKQLSNKYYDYLLSQKGKTTEDPSLGKLWDWLGTEVTLESGNKEFRQSAEDLELLKSIVKNGVPQETIETQEYVGYPALTNYYNKMTAYTKEKQLENPNWDPNTDSTFQILASQYTSELSRQMQLRGNSGGPKLQTVISENPRYSRYIALQNLYDTTDLNTLLQKHESAHNEKININKYTILNNTTGTRVMRYLGNQITSGRNDEDLSKIIYQEDSNKKKIDADPEKVREALSSKDSTIQINFNNGKVRINNTNLGTFYIDKTTLHNLNVPIILHDNIPIDIKQLFGMSANNNSTVLPADVYIDTVSNLQKQLKNLGYTKELSTNIVNGLIQNFYTHLEANTRSMITEQPVTSTQ